MALEDPNRSSSWGSSGAWGRILVHHEGILPMKGQSLAVSGIPARHTDRGSLRSPMARNKWSWRVFARVTQTFRGIIHPVAAWSIQRCRSSFTWWVSSYLFPVFQYTCQRRIWYIIFHFSFRITITNIQAITSESHNCIYGERGIGKREETAKF